MPEVQEEMNLADNSKTTAKPRGKPFPKGVSGNPKGAPKRGESWAEIIKAFGDLTPLEAAEKAQEIGKQLRKYGGDLTLKQAVVVRIYAALLFEPQAALLNSFMDRAEGKVPDHVDLSNSDGTLTRIEIVLPKDESDEN